MAVSAANKACLGRIEAQSFELAGRILLHPRPCIREEEGLERVMHPTTATTTKATTTVVVLNRLISVDHHGEVRVN
jgi:hypothetical protein